MTPFTPSVFNGRSPAVAPVDATFQHQELQDVLQTRTESLTADWKVERRQIMGFGDAPLIMRVRQEVSE